ncbi:GrpB family protein [Lentibacillus sediminis]|uniref:GrpB family protein n=1 Tax=Lentibacillus sediminis TaxID=1940529 RepID=UPI000C1B95F2|nr:GrpB family protein [Lentibacillus sediminis]
MRKVEVTSYNINWPAMFKEEANKLHSIFGSETIEIHHIGSTSVNGLKAKPVIDMMPVVKNISRVDDFNTAMMGIGYEPLGENGISGRRYFRKGGDDRTHHVHVFELGSGDIERHLAFRDYLGTHPDALQSYGDLKEELARSFPDDMESYIKGKEPFVLEIERKALIWYQSSR